LVRTETTFGQATMASRPAQLENPILGQIDSKTVTDTAVVLCVILAARC
jgi:hypothetical protein